MLLTLDGIFVQIGRKICINPGNSGVDTKIKRGPSVFSSDLGRPYLASGSVDGLGSA